jgi:hypothetical protein
MGIDGVCNSAIKGRFNDSAMCYYLGEKPRKQKEKTRLFFILCLRFLFFIFTRGFVSLFFPGLRPCLIIIPASESDCDNVINSRPVIFVEDRDTVIQPRRLLDRIATSTSPSILYCQLSRSKYLFPQPHL